jgi:hypothetical protein
MRLALSILLAASAFTVAACGDDVTSTDNPTAGLPGNAALLAQIRGATMQYQDVNAALADGYVSTHECVAIPGAAMGVHYVKPALAGDASSDPTKPEVLVYEPKVNGTFTLVAVEYIIMRAPWDAANPGKLPNISGSEFDKQFGGPMGDMYALHAWVWRDNPDGVVTPFNKNVACPVTSASARHQH